MKTLNKFNANLDHLCQGISVQTLEELRSLQAWVRSVYDNPEAFCCTDSFTSAPCRLILKESLLWGSPGGEYVWEPSHFPEYGTFLVTAEYDTQFALELRERGYAFHNGRFHNSEGNTIVSVREEPYDFVYTPEVAWYDNLTKPVLCKVGRDSYRLIVREVCGFFEDTTGWRHDRAEPVGKEILEYLL